MGHVSKETKEKLDTFIDALSEQELSKCTLCAETLTHITKKAEVETGAGTYTVTNALAHFINETAVAQDQISGKALNNRVRRNEGKDTKNPNRGNRDTSTDGINPNRGNRDTSPSSNAYGSNRNESKTEAISVEKVAANVIAGQKLILAALYNLKQLQDMKKLKNDNLFREVENQLRLIHSYAADLGINF